MIRNSRSSFALFWGTVFVGITLITVRTAPASEELAYRHYADGIHDYFANRLSQAAEHFRRAIAQGVHDPRFYYFRGLARYRLGQVEEGQGDFELGARLETRRGESGIGESLERVQGRERLVLEQYRRFAREQFAAHPARRTTRPEQVASGQTSGTPGASPAQTTPGPEQRIPATIPESTADDANDPFRQDVADQLGRGEVTAQPATSEVEAPSDATPTATGETNPFEDQPVGTGAADLFGESAPQPEAGPPAATGEKKPGALGAILRALRRSVTPDLNAIPGADMLPPIPGITGGSEPDIFGAGQDPNAVIPGDSETPVQPEPEIESIAPPAGGEADSGTENPFDGADPEDPFGGTDNPFDENAPSGESSSETPESENSGATDESPF